MTLTIELPPDVESRLREEAEKQGLEAGELAGRLIEKQLPGTPPQEASREYPLKRL